MMMEYAGQGEVFKHLAKAGKFSEKRASRVSQSMRFSLKLIGSMSAKLRLDWRICMNIMSFIAISSRKIYY